MNICKKIREKILIGTIKKFSWRWISRVLHSNTLVYFLFKGKKTRERIFKQNPRRIFEQKSEKTAWRNNLWNNSSKKSAKDYLKENQWKNIRKKIPEEFSKESPLKNIQTQFHVEYLSKNPQKLPGEKVWETILQENPPKNIRKKTFKRKYTKVLKLSLLLVKHCVSVLSERTTVKQICIRS